MVLRLVCNWKWKLRLAPDSNKLIDCTRLSKLARLQIAPRGFGTAGALLVAHQQSKDSQVTPSTQVEAKPYRRFTAEEDAKIIALRAQGVKFLSIARELPLRHRKTISSRWYKTLRPRIVPNDELRRRHYRPFTAEEDAKIRALREQGIGWLAITRELPWRNRDTIRSRWNRILCLRSGFKARRFRQVFETSEEEKLLQLKAQGLKWREIAKEFPDRHSSTLKGHYNNMILEKGCLSRDSDPAQSPWTTAEDAELYHLRHERRLQWPQIARQMPGKTFWRLQKRYYDHVRREAALPASRLWTTEDDMRLHKLRRAGLGFKQMLPEFPDRTEEALIQRYYSQLYDAET